MRYKAAFVWVFSLALIVLAGTPEKPAKPRLKPSAPAPTAKVPVWNFHGVNDPVEPTETSRAILSALQSNGGKSLYTEYPDVRHNSFMWAYTESAMVELLFAPTQ